VRIHNEITLQAPADELFEFLSDVERVGPCLPGATIEGRDGEDYAGRMKVKVGPINATYQGKLRFLELDKDARRAVMRARAEEVNGQGNAEASITTEVEEADGGNSVIRMDTDLQIRGKVAQFGRGAMEKISQRMFEQFAGNIEEAFNGGGGPAPEPGESEAPQAEAATEPGKGRPAPSRAAAPADDDEGQALDVLGMLGGTNVAKAAPVVAVVLVALGYGYLYGRLRESRATVQRMARLL
jgi:carbon monoxide dehydrogenase subunit G